MDVIDKLSVVEDPTPINVTFGSLAPSDVYKNLDIRPEDLLSEPNLIDEDQTYIYSHNGSSTILRIKFGKELFSLPRQKQPREFFKILQKWEGYVINVGRESFWARLIPIVGEGNDQDAEILIDEIDEEDRSLLEPGSLFYWSIGYLDRPSGRLRASLIRFRRLPLWSQDDLGKAEIEARRLIDLFNASE